MLDEEAVKQLKFTITTLGWMQVIEPGLSAERGTAMDQLAAPDQLRGAPKFSDEWLRGYIRGLDFTRKRWMQLIEEFYADLEREKRQEELPAAGSVHAATPEEAATP